MEDGNARNAQVVEDETPDPVDDGIAVGVPPAPRSVGTEPPRGPSKSSPGSSEATTEESGQVDQAGELVDVENLRAERDEFLSALQRLQADFENYRKRIQRQGEERASRGALDLVTKLLPVLDTLDLAYDHLTSTTGGLAGTGEEVAMESAETARAHEADALGQSRVQLLEVLTKEGLERFDETEVAFDPMIHDAVAHTNPDRSDSDPSSNSNESVVDEVMRAGYRWRGQVLRPAMVRVRG